MSEPKTYELRTVADFMALAPEQIGPCVIDFVQWIDAHFKLRALLAAQPDLGLKLHTPTDVFSWVDDGKHVMTVTVNDAAGRELLRDEHEFAEPEAPQ